MSAVRHFSLVDRVWGLGIDLEIDEPYEGKFKTPHHCTNNSKDRERNEFMLAKGWIVLRVSEYQVVHQPESVCKLVTQIFKSVVGGESYQWTIFPGVPRLTPDPMWNSVGVKQMIARKYRERYLDKAGIFKYDEQRERAQAITLRVALCDPFQLN